MARQRVDLTGRVIGRLTVVGRMPFSQQGNTYWECQCECGNTCYVAHSNLSTGNQKSCGRACRLRPSQDGCSRPAARTAPKLNALKAAIIRQEYASESRPISQQKLARKYKVSKQAILKIVNGHTYKPQEKAA